MGIVGTADGITTLQDETPKAFFKRKEALDALKPSEGKEPGSLYFAVLGVHDQTEDVIVLVKAKTAGDSDMEKAVKALLDAESITGYKPKVFIATKLEADKAGPTNPTNPTNPTDPTSPTDPVNPLNRTINPHAHRVKTTTLKNRGDE